MSAEVVSADTSHSGLPVSGAIKSVRKNWHLDLNMNIIEPLLLFGFI